MNKKRKKENKIGTFILIIAVIVFTVLGAGYSERILNIYVNSKDKK